MKTVLAISSQVVRGHIGLGAVGPGIEALGHEVWPLPTVLLSNHPGHRHGAGQCVVPPVLEEMIDALDANGWLERIDAVISGYLPTTDHVEFVRRVVTRVRGMRDITYLCDPVIGDDPKGLYIEQDVAGAIRDHLVGRADLVTPNRLELSWLTGMKVDGPDTAGEAGKVLVGKLGAGAVAATAIPSMEAGETQTGSTFSDVMYDGEATWQVTSDRLPDVPHGVGDLFGGLLLGHVLNGCGLGKALGKASAGVRVAIENSRGSDELVLAGMQERMAGARSEGVRGP